jgi:hypothetical protein
MRGKGYRRNSRSARYSAKTQSRVPGTVALSVSVDGALPAPRHPSKIGNNTASARSTAFASSVPRGSLLTGAPCRSSPHGHVEEIDPAALEWPAQHIAGKRGAERGGFTGGRKVDSDKIGDKVFALSPA